MNNPMYRILKSHKAVEDFVFELSQEAQFGSNSFIKSIYAFYQANGFLSIKQVCTVLDYFRKQKEDFDNR